MLCIFLTINLKQMTSIFLHTNLCASVTKFKYLLTSALISCGTHQMALAPIIKMYGLCGTYTLPQTPPYLDSLVFTKLMSSPINEASLLSREHNTGSSPHLLR